MSLDTLVDLIHDVPRDGKAWERSNTEAFTGLFGGEGGRYPKNAADTVKLRSPWNEVPFAAYVHPDSPDSGAYSGFSFAVFPVPDSTAPCLVSLCVGTDGLGQDDVILGKPGHARKTQAIAAWLNGKYGHGEQVTWAKHDPTQTDVEAPIAKAWSDPYRKIFDKYGKVIYLAFRPGADRKGTRTAIAAILDLFFAERGQAPLKAYLAESRDMENEWLNALMPTTTPDELAETLRERRFVILEGPPGTGKTRMATCDLLQGEYAGNGMVVQFHPNMTYETFIGGLAPVVAGGPTGLRFEPTPGILMRAAERALSHPEKPFLLLVDEINRADLAKILGESLYLFEWPLRGEQARRVELPFDFGSPFGRQLFLPENLHVLGTMNTADRSIAILDVAVRRRFGFVSLWPRADVLLKQDAPKIMQRAFHDLTMIFVEHATEGAFSLCPGHSYFLPDGDEPARQLRNELAPLLREYLAQGYVSGFAEPLRNYLQWLASL